MELQLSSGETCIKIKKQCKGDTFFKDWFTESPTLKQLASEKICLKVIFLFLPNASLCGHIGHLKLVCMKVELHDKQTRAMIALCMSSLGTS